MAHVDTREVTGGLRYEANRTLQPDCLASLQPPDRGTAAILES
jgi:hypothetical protein